jgi:hypothetical protein
MPMLELEFEVYCACGNGLCGQTKEGNNNHSQFITVEPCEDCKSLSYDDGKIDGYNECEQDNNDI